MSTDSKQSSGVQQLIDQLREEGVVKGHDEAAALLEEAQRKATELLDNAHFEAEAIIARAKKEAEQTKSSGMDALSLASRDVILSVKESFRAEFVGKVRRLVAHTLQDREFLKELILEIARRAVPYEEGRSIEILLPEHPVSMEQVRQDPAGADSDPVSQFALGMAGDVLREGITFAAGEPGGTGVSLRLLEDDVQIDLTDATITELLMQHLLPRFRAILGD